MFGHDTLSIDGSILVNDFGLARQTAVGLARRGATNVLCQKLAQEFSQKIEDVGFNRG
jgi:hypothetical protein